MYFSHQVDTTEHTKTKNGKKICWNFRKGRCRFGSNCTFAHDSDLHKSNDIEHQQGSSNTTQQNSDDCVEQKTTKPKSQSAKKRPDLSSTLIPSKKVMNQYYSVKATK